MATFSSGVKCFRSFLIRSLRYLNGGTLSPVLTEAGQISLATPTGRAYKAQPRLSKIQVHDSGRGNRCLELIRLGDEPFGELAAVAHTLDAHDPERSICGVSVSNGRTPVRRTRKTGPR